MQPIFLQLQIQSKAKDRLPQRLDKIINWKTSDYGLVWKSAYDVWQEAPLFGAGLHKYREACELLGIYGTRK